MGLVLLLSTRTFTRTLTLPLTRFLLPVTRETTSTVTFLDVSSVLSSLFSVFTCMVGQLNTQVNASICMIDFINNYISLFTFWCCMVVEFVGIVHSSYAIQMAIGSMAGKPIESKEPPKEGFTLMFFWLRVLWSFGLLGFSLTVTIAALFEGKTTMWDGVPEIVSLILFFGLMSVVGMLEGMQIAFFYVAKLSEEERG